MTESVPVPAGEKVSTLARATIFVRNQAESLKLYRDILGLKPHIDNLVEGEAINTIQGTKGVSLKAAILQSGDSISGNLGIYEIINGPPAAPMTDTRTSVRTGDYAVVFYTDQLDALSDKIIKAGYRIVSPPIILFTDPKKTKQSREMLFFDADGMLVNLIEQGK
ncbi:VOC family protein [Polymorphobacter sp.]|uniref:VOC family protein n=1 Tax=Polymorphobacter sp. TaxID=1909290 RepID=UPI003F6F2006